MLDQEQEEDDLNAIEEGFLQCPRCDRFIDGGVTCRACGRHGCSDCLDLDEDGLCVTCAEEKEEWLRGLAQDSEVEAEPEWELD